MTIASPLDWAHAVEAGLGLPPGGNDDQTLVKWAAAEGGAGPEFGVPNNVTNYNPINVSLTSGSQGYGYDPGTGKFYPGATPTPGNSPPIASFSDWNTGIQATVDRLQEPFAAPILAGLKAEAPVSQTAAAVASTGWGTGNFAGLSATGTQVATPGPGGAGTANLTGYNLNPLDLFGIPQTAGAAAGSAVWSAVGPFLVKAILVSAGLAVILLGAWKAANPGVSFRQSAESGAEGAAKIGEVAAA